MNIYASNRVISGCNCGGGDGARDEDGNDDVVLVPALTVIT